MEPKVTMRDIAEKLDISINTVSLALRNKPGIKDETRAQIIEMAKTLGYAAKSIDKDNPNILVISSPEHSSDNYFYSKLIHIIEEKLIFSGYNMLITNQAETWIQNENFAKKLKESKICGVLIVGDLKTEFVNTILDSQVPTITLGFYLRDRAINTVIEDNISGMMQILGHLKNKGYRQIGYIGIRDTVGLEERYIGFMGGCVEYGFETDAKYILNDLPAETSEHSVLLENYLRQLKKLPEVFVFAHDRLAILAMKILFNMGIKTPDDIGIVGYDNSEMAKFSIPTLTTVDVFAKNQADIAIKNLIDLIETPSPIPVKSVLPVQLIPGGTLK